MTSHPDHRFVRLMHTYDSLKFGLAKGALESEKLPFTSRGDPASGVNYKRMPIRGDDGGMELLVPAELLERAREILDGILGKPDA